jgi:hypothetical protein
MRLAAYGNGNNDGSDRYAAVGGVDDDKQQRRQALEGEDNGEVLGQRFGHGGGEWRKQRRRTRAAEDSGRGGFFGDVKRAYRTE